LVIRITKVPASPNKEVGRFKTGKGYREKDLQGGWADDRGGEEKPRIENNKAAKKVLQCSVGQSSQQLIIRTKERVILEREKKKMGGGARATFGLRIKRFQSEMLERKVNRKGVGRLCGEETYRGTDQVQ